MRIWSCAFVAFVAVAAFSGVGYADRFVDNGDGTVTDTATRLMWAAKDNGRDVTWDQAVVYCENYGGGGHADWRMPTMDELKSLYDKGSSQEIECGFWKVNVAPQIDLTCMFVWSSEKREGSNACSFLFNSGFERIHDIKDSYLERALPVRAQR